MYKSRYTPEKWLKYYQWWENKVKSRLYFVAEETQYFVDPSFDDTYQWVQDYLRGREHWMCPDSLDVGFKKSDTIISVTYRTHGGELICVKLHG